MFSALTVVALASTSFMMVLAQCPCQKFDLDQYAFYCSNRSLSSIPACVPNNITRLAIRTASIPLVPETIRRFTNIRRLDIGLISNPQLSKTFLNGRNNISVFEIYATSLDYVDSDWFQYAPRLTTVYLQNNRIDSLAADTFKSLPLLSRVEMQGNKLTTLPPTLFEGTSLKYLRLGNNPWHCDCELSRFMQWVRDKRVSMSDQAYCLHPVELKGLDLIGLTPNIACRN